MGSFGPSDRRVPPSPSPQECVGFVAPRPPEGRCGLFDENSSDTCKAPRGARGFHQFAALQASNMEVRGEPRRRDSPRLPVNPSILLRKRGSPGRRPAGGGAHTAGLPRSFPQRRGEAFGTEPSRVWSCRRTLPVLNPESARNAANWRERRSGGPRAETGASRERDAVARFRLRLLGRALPEEEAAARVSVRGIPKPQDYKNPFQSRRWTKLIQFIKNLSMIDNSTSTREFIPTQKRPQHLSSVLWMDDEYFRNLLCWNVLESSKNGHQNRKSDTRSMKIHL